MHFLASLFGILIVLLDGCVVTRFRASYDTPLMLYLGLVVGQLALLAFWCVMARGILTARLLATLVAIALLSQPLGRVTGGNWAEWFTLLCLFTACTGGVVRVTQWCGFRPQILDLPKPVCAAPPNPRRAQFSLGGLLSITTFVALGLGLARHVTLPGYWAAAAASYGFWLVLIATATLWAVVSRQPFVTRLLLLAVLCLVAGWSINQTEHLQDVGFFTAIVMLETTVICAGIGAVQAAVRVPLAPDP